VENIKQDKQFSLRRTFSDGFSISIFYVKTTDLPQLVTALVHRQNPFYKVLRRSVFMKQNLRLGLDWAIWAV
jgi:hypothetical protein